MGSSRELLPPVAAALREKEDCLESKGVRVLCVVECRPLLETSLLERLSLNSADELGLLFDIIAFLELFPYREELLPLSESGCCTKNVFVRIPN